MSRPPRDIPSIPASVPEELARPLRAMREAVQRLMGNRGDLLDSALTGRSGLVGGGGGTVIVGGGSVGGGGTYIEDLTPPPTVTDLAVSAGFSQVIVSWTGIGYTQGNGNRQTLIYAVRKDPSDATMPLFGEATLVATAPHALTIISIPSELNTRWHVWAKFQTNDGVLSVSPAGGTNGVQDTTGQDVAQLLEVLTGQITESELFSTLGDRINLIDGDSDVPGSVNFRLAATEDDITAAFVAADATGYTNAQTYVQGYAYNKATVDGAFTSQFNALTANYEAADAGVFSAAQAYVGTYTYAKATIDGAFSTQSTTLTAAFEAADLTVASNAAAYVNSYTYAKATTDAIAGSVTTLVSRVGADTEMTTLRFWGFDASLDGWAGTSGSAVWQAGGTTAWTPSGTNHNFSKNTLTVDERFQGAAATLVRARVKRLSGTGAWEGRCYYTTSGHGNTNDYTKQIAAPSNPDEWNVLEWDMAALTAGGTDWVDNEILGLRIDLVSDGGTSVWAFDWVAVGQPTITPMVAALQQELLTRATQTGELYGQWTVKLDLNGYVSGFGLASTGGTAAPFSQFIVRADSFSVASPSGPGITPIVPFVVNTTTQTVNGVSVPPGVYMDAAFVKNGTIVGAKIGNATIDDAKIANLSAAKVTFGTMSGDRISANTLNADRITAGTLDAGQVATGFLSANRIAAGAITADKINSNNLTIKDGSGNIIFSAAQNLDWARINATVGGGNLLPNSSFELESSTAGQPEGWTGTSIGSNITIARTLTGFSKVDGALSFVWSVDAIIAPTGTSQHFHMQTQAAQTPVFGGQPYALSIWARPSTVVWQGRVGIGWYDSDNVLIGSVDYLPTFTFPSAFNWHRIKGTLTAPANAAFARVRFGIVRPSVNNTTLGSIRWDAVQLELGDVVTAYAPSARDKVGIDNPITASNASTYLGPRAVVGDLMALGTIQTENLVVGAATQSAVGGFVSSPLTISGTSTTATMTATNILSFTRGSGSRPVFVTANGQVSVTLRSSGFTAGTYQFELQLFVGTTGLSKLQKVRMAGGNVAAGGVGLFFPFSMMFQANTQMFPSLSARDLRVSVSYFALLNNAGTAIACLDAVSMDIDASVWEFKV